MDAAKHAVKDFMSKSGHHDTTVHEKVAPAVTHETHTLQHHENITTAVDKEIHQDHYHTSVQPVKDSEVLPEQHHHNLGAVEHRQFHHGNDRDVKDRLAAEAAQFTDKRIEGEARHTQTVNPTIGGEHIHHHVHETIQPIVSKDTIEPHVVHTTVPIHEVHHNAAQHHSTSALPAVSMADFKKQGGVLTGREERYDGFEGEPRTVGGSTTGLSGHHGHHGHHGTTGTGKETLGERAVDAVEGREREAITGREGHHHGHHGSTTSGLTGSNTSGLTGSNNYGSSTGTGRDTYGTTGTGRETLGERGRDAVEGREREAITGREGYDSTGNSVAGSNIDPKTGKPSLIDRLNPMKDTDHDGKKGFMD